jgi:hypothetical protein
MTQALPNAELPARSSFVLCYNTGLDEFQLLFGGEPSLLTSRVNGNGDDAYTLDYGGVVYDTYGQVGFDGTGLPWEYTNLIVKRNTLVNRPSPVFDVTEWGFYLDADAAPFSRD